MTDSENEPAPGGQPEAGNGNNTSTPKRTSKPVRLPWEDKPHVDLRTATQRAINAARPPSVDLNSPAVKAHARKALNDETASLRGSQPGTPGEGRNMQLFKSAANLFELVAAGALDEAEVVDALRNACLDNHYIQDDGEAAFTKTLASGRRAGLDKPRDLSNVGRGPRAGDIYADDEPKLLVFDDFRRLERGFWTERGSLQHIYMAALSRMCPPWAVLAHCVVRALALVRPHVTLPHIIGHGSLNFFAAVVAKSGDGKSAAEDIALDLINTAVQQRNLGSGEGLIDAYVRPANKATGEPEGLHESILFIADEADSLRALGSRSGATLSSTLRSAFTGKQLGFSYRNNPRHLDARTYRLTFLVNVQPAKAGVLLEDETGGLLQRLIWFPGNDPRIDAQKPPWPGPLTLPSPAAWLYPRELKIPYEAHELIIDSAEARGRGETDPLDGHALFAREKLAYALAVLDGRDVMALDDWRLAGIVSRVSDHTRAFAAQQAELAAVADAEKRGTERGVELDAASGERDRRAWERAGRIDRRIINRLKDAGAAGVTEGELGKMPPARDRHMIRTRLHVLVNQGLAVQVERQSRDRSDRYVLADYAPARK